MSSTAHARRHRFRTLGALAAGILAVGSLAACGGGDDDEPAASDPSGQAIASEVRLGYFANVTHAGALIGVNEGYFEEELGDTKLTTQTFNAGTEAIEAIFADALDISFIGPNPAINAHGESGGEAIRIVSGSTSGGAQFIVRDGISDADDLKGTTIATPSLGNTQDVALRAWLTDEGLENSVEGGGDVAVAPTKNSDTLALFKAGDLDGAWVPEPWSSRLVLEADGEVLVDEAELWPDGDFVTTHIIVRTEFLEEYPGTVEAILKAHLSALELAESDEAAAKAAVQAQLTELADAPLPDEVLERAWANLRLTADPIASSLEKSAKDAVTAGTAEEEVDLAGIYDLSLLNGLLEAAGDEKVSSGGLGTE